MEEYCLHYTKYNEPINGVVTSGEEVVALTARNEGLAREEAAAIIGNDNKISKGDPYLVMSKYGVRSKWINL